MFVVCAIAFSTEQFQSLCELMCLCGICVYIKLSKCCHIYVASCVVNIPSNNQFVTISF